MINYEWSGTMTIALILISIIPMCVGGIVLFSAVKNFDDLRNR